MNRGAACPDTQSLRSKRSLLARGVRRVGATDLEDHVGGSFPLGDLHRCSTQGGGVTFTRPPRFLARGLRQPSIQGGIEPA